MQSDTTLLYSTVHWTQWECVTWQSATRQCFTWQSVTRQSVIRQCVTRQGVTRQCVTWQSVTRQSVTRQTVTWQFVARQSVTRKCVTRQCVTWQCVTVAHALSSIRETVTPSHLAWCTSTKFAMHVLAHAPSVLRIAGSVITSQIRHTVGRQCKLHTSVP